MSAGTRTAETERERDREREREREGGEQLHKLHYHCHKPKLTKLRINESPGP